MTEYDLRNAINVLFKFVQILNNGFIKLGRNYLKGKEGPELCKEFLNV
ncbi:MAG: hypothetical protein Gaeavirus17_9, partial [Gaeavirus sp.]